MLFELYVTVPSPALTVTAFIRYLKNGNLVEDDGFDIDEYSYEDNEEE